MAHNYDFLKPAEQARLLRQRLVNVEREHFSAVIDEDAGTPLDPEALKEIEARLDTFRKRLTEVEAAAAKEKGGIASSEAKK